ncbi:MAG: hypothetical protein PHW77_08045, partial [Eubacteriales bacterium]|nr:hypothetical protein [Eubacteriales bacterium]
NSRVRFIYISFLFKRIKKGWSFKAYETPNGIAAETVRKPEEGKIFECYNIVRYSKDYSVITDEVVAKIYETEENA